MGLVSSGPFWAMEAQASLGGPRALREEETELGGVERLTSSPEEETSGPGSLSLKEPFHPEAQQEVGLRSKPGPCPSRKQKRPGDMAMVERV